MRALLIWPRFPPTFWSFEGALALIGRKALVPPLGLITVAALLPADWELRLVDCNLRAPAPADWDWADLVMLSAMNVQRADFLSLIATARARGRPVVVGGPYATSVPAEAAAAGADYLVLDEAEVTLPPFLDLIAREWPAAPRPPGAPPRVFRAHGRRPDLAATPPPRFDLLDLAAYHTMAVQFSRGCPFRCEFCDITTLYGRRPRTKPPARLLAELEALYALGWRRKVLLVDDNLIGNRAAVEDLLRALYTWQEERGFPFGFWTEVSIDLAADPQLLALMRDCRFHGVFIGIETPDLPSLRHTRKHQNTRRPLAADLALIADHGMRVMASFIIGFDGEAPGAGRRILEFVEANDLPAAMVSMLHVLPQTDLWHRLEREGRLLPHLGTVNQDQAINFVPTRPAAELVAEYLDLLAALTDPARYLDLCYRCCLRLRRAPRAAAPARISRRRTAGERRAARRETLMDLRGLLRLCWRQGVRRNTRWHFWGYLIDMARRNPAVLVDYLAVCSHNEHFLIYLGQVRCALEAQLPGLPRDFSGAGAGHASTGG